MFVHMSENRTRTWIGRGKLYSLKAKAQCHWRYLVKVPPQKTSYKSHRTINQQKKPSEGKFTPEKMPHPTTSLLKKLPRNPLCLSGPYERQTWGNTVRKEQSFIPVSGLGWRELISSVPCLVPCCNSKRSEVNVSIIAPRYVSSRIRE